MEKGVKKENKHVNINTVSQNITINIRCFNRLVNFLGSNPVVDVKSSTCFFLLPSSFFANIHTITLAPLRTFLIFFISYQNKLRKETYRRQ